MKNSRWRAALIAAPLLTLLAAPALARPELCESAAAAAAREVGVPVDVLQAIALTETGRRVDGQMRPWPWAANTEGQGHWFNDRNAVLAFVRETIARGQRSIDIGCFQINWRWHGAHFPAPEALLDPPTAARYAARHLADLHTELGTWEAAAGAYHSRTPSLSARYRARFAEMRASLIGHTPRHDIPQIATHQATHQANRGTMGSALPLLTGTASGASLVPTSRPGSPPLIALRP